jgi:hypothetical protein
MNNRYNTPNTPKQAMSRLFALYSPKYITNMLGIDNAHIYRARQGEITPTLRRALQDRGLVPPPRRRVRFSGDVDPELRDAIVADARQLEITNGEMLALMWQAWDESKR